MKSRRRYLYGIAASSVAAVALMAGIGGGTPVQAGKPPALPMGVTLPDLTHKQRIEVAGHDGKPLLGKDGKPITVEVGGPAEPPSQAAMDAVSRQMAAQANSATAQKSAAAQDAQLRDGKPHTMPDGSIIQLKNGVLTQTTPTLSDRDKARAMAPDQAP